MVAHPNKLVHIHEHTHTHPQNPSESLLFNFPCVYYFIYFFKVLGNFTHLLSPFSILKIFFCFYVSKCLARMCVYMSSNCSTPGCQSRPLDPQGSAVQMVVRQCGCWKLNLWKSSQCCQPQSHLSTSIQHCSKAEGFPLFRVTSLSGNFALTQIAITLLTC